MEQNVLACTNCQRDEFSKNPAAGTVANGEEKRRKHLKNIKFLLMLLNWKNISRPPFVGLQSSLYSSKHNWNCIITIIEKKQKQKQKISAYKNLWDHHVIFT